VGHGEYMQQIDSILSEFEGQKHELIPILQKVQAELGYLPKETMQQVAEFARVSEARVYAVATFYAQFRFVPIGKKHVVVCRGTACHVQGANRILDELKRILGIKDGGVTDDGEYSLETVACIGACGLSPCIIINKKVHAKVKPEKLVGILGK